MSPEERRTTRGGRLRRSVVMLSGAVVLGWIASAVSPVTVVIDHEYLRHGMLLVSADILAEGLNANFALRALIAFGGLGALLLVRFLWPQRPRWIPASRLGPRCELGLHVAAVCALLIHGLLNVYVHAERQDALASAPNVLLVVIDTLRADHLGHAGRAAVRTPVLDAFARDSVVFERAYSAASWTRPAIASILTSATPVQLGITRESPRQVLPKPYVTLQEYFRDRGYRTAALYTNPHFKFGLDQQFDMIRFGGDTRAEFVANWAIEYLDGHRDGRFFLLVHLNDPHDDYEHRKGFSTHPRDSIYRRLKPFMPLRQDGGRRTSGSGDRAPVRLDDDQLAAMKAHYDGEIAYVDHHLGRLLAHLRDLGLEDDTIVIVTADHGEEFLEHGSYWHGLTLYEEVLRVPLIVRIPGYQAREVTDRVGTVDVFPTVAELVEGRPVRRDSWAGRSLVPLLRGEPRPPRPLFAVTEFRDALKYSLVFEDTKLIRYADGEIIGLFDLARDPGEQDDLSGTDADRLAAMEAMLAEVLSGEVAAADAEPVELDEASRAALSQLGYVDA